MTRNFLRLLFDKRRLSFLPAIYRELVALSDKKNGRIRAEIISAEVLSDEIADRLKMVIQKATGNTVILTKREDSELIGGIITRVENLMYDGSVKNSLIRMRQNMLDNGR
jgi:F-type H+-transporting ATPase subunit delta